jgi:hypothetical protein
MGSRHPVRQLGTRGRAREMIVEIDAEHPIPDLPGAGACLGHDPSVPAACRLLVLPCSASLMHRGGSHLRDVASVTTRTVTRPCRCQGQRRQLRTIVLLAADQLGR